MVMYVDYTNKKSRSIVDDIWFGCLALLAPRSLCSLFGRLFDLWRGARSWRARKASYRTYSTYVK